MKLLRGAVCRLLIALITFGFVVLNSFGQIPGSIDVSFDPGPFINGSIQGLARQSDGKWLIVGAFTSVQGAVRNYVARLNPDGTTDTSFMDGMAGANNVVNCVAIQSDGNILIGGAFSSVNGVNQRSIARLFPDGTLDTSFLNGLAGPLGPVNCIIAQSSGNILIGGSFSKVNGVTHVAVARLIADGSLDTTFQNGLGASDSFASVNSIAVDSSGRILAGGKFQFSNGVSRCIARLFVDGTLDGSFQPYADNTVRSVIALGSGKILIAGDFLNLGALSHTYVARLNSNGSTDSTFYNAPINGAVYSMALQPDGRIAIGGRFTSVNDVGGHQLTRNYIAQLNSDGAADVNFQNGLSGANSYVLAVASQSDSNVVAGGIFGTMNGVARLAIARLKPDGLLDTTFENPVTGADSSVFSVALQPDGRVLLGGNFTRVNAVPRSRVARMNSNGSLDPDFLNGLTGANNSILSMLVQPDNRIVAAGLFTTMNGVARGRVARLLTDGSIDDSFQNGMAGANNNINTAALQPDGKIVLGGWFTTFNGISRSRLARVGVDGTLDDTFQNGLPGANNNVNALAIQPDGKIIVAGLFTTVNGTNRNEIARVNADGSLDAQFLGNLPGANGPVNCVALQWDGKILLAGNFTTMNGVSRNRIARLNSDGSLDPSFGNGMAGANAVVYALIIQPGKIVIGGSFTSVNGVARTRVARLNRDGSLDTTFQSGMTGADNDVRAIAPQVDDQLLLGGAFLYINGTGRSRIARLNSGPLLPELIAPEKLNDGTFRWVAFGQAGHSYLIQMSTDLLNWSDYDSIFLNSATYPWIDANASLDSHRFYRLNLQ
jgi:uncharacterized delta-60 repeat protein